jgi:hypothetical protein
MKTTIRLAAALLAVAAFTTAWAGDSDSEAKDKAVTAAQEEALSDGSGAGEPSSFPPLSDVEENRLQHETWEAGD